MACMAQVAIGAGRAEYRGEVLAGGEALRRAGIAPLVLGGKDGLALMSANGVSVGHGALVVVRAERTARAADLAASLSMEATGANVSIVHPAVGRAKPIPGQIAAADHIRELLKGSALLDPAGARSVQDALSFRVVPQVHGGAARVRRGCRGRGQHGAETPPATTRSSPLPERALVSNGNFQPVVMAISLRRTADHAGACRAAERPAHDAFVGRVLPAAEQRPARPQWRTACKCGTRRLPRYAELRQLGRTRDPSTPRLSTSALRTTAPGATAERSQGRRGARSARGRPGLRAAASP